jgi:TRAP-type C4-dicarboxylate transport system permease small subunit
MDPMEHGQIIAVLGSATTPIMQQLVARLEFSASLSGADQLATITALQMAFIAGAQAARSEVGIVNWELPLGDQWANQHAQDGA